LDGLELQLGQAPLLKLNLLFSLYLILL